MNVNSERRTEKETEATTRVVAERVRVGTNTVTGVGAAVVVIAVVSWNESW